MESAGPVFSYQVNFPLTGSSVAKKESNSSDSAWDRAKREVQSSGPGQVQIEIIVQDNSSGGYGGGYGHGWNTLHDQTPAFDKEKVDTLLDILIGAFGEAKNIRHLKPSDSVTITVVGTDDSSAPARLTLKAGKKDIDQLAEGKLEPEKFRQKVAQDLY